MLALQEPSHTPGPTHTQTLGQHRGNVISNELCRSVAYQYASPSPTEKFFFAPLSVSTCYLLSGTRPSLSQRHPNAPSFQLRKRRKCVLREVAGSFCSCAAGFLCGASCSRFAFDFLQIQSNRFNLPPVCMYFTCPLVKIITFRKAMP